MKFKKSMELSGGIKDFTLMLIRIGLDCYPEKYQMSINSEEHFWGLQEEVLMVNKFSNNLLKKE